MSHKNERIKLCATHMQISVFINCYVLFCLRKSKCMSHRLVLVPWKENELINWLWWRCWVNFLAKRPQKASLQQPVDRLNRTEQGTTTLLHVGCRKQSGLWPFFKLEYNEWYIWLLCRPYVALNIHCTRTGPLLRLLSFNHEILSWQPRNIYGIRNLY